MSLNYTIEDCCMIGVPTFIDGRDAISVLDQKLPFQVKRVFWLYHIQDGKDRGAHALLGSSELIVAVHGSFIVDMDDTVNKTSKKVENVSSKPLTHNPNLLTLDKQSIYILI